MIAQYNYDKYFLKDIISDKKIKVPQFQRNVVWNSKKKKEFIDNLREGNPFGSILVHQVNNQEVVLIDGLQRISTIRDYINNPYKYFEPKDIDDIKIYEMIEHAFSLKKYYFDKDSTAVKVQVNDIKKRIFQLMIEKVDNSDIFFQLVEKYDLINDKVTFSCIEKIINCFNEQVDISNLIVPTIIYTGPSESLPGIFYNLNTGGVNLTKYETFSSLWNPKKFILNDEEINNKIYEKYEVLREKSDLEVDVTIEELREIGITFFEYCYSISELLRDKKKKYRLILGENKKSTDPIGFEILSLISGLAVNKAESLDKKFKNVNSKFLIELKNVIIDTFSTISDILGDWVKAENGTTNTLDSNYMIYHMAIAYIKNNYSINFETNEIVKLKDSGRWNDGYKKYLHLHYIKDYISDFWKRNRQVNDLSREINNIESLNKYSRNISKEEWDQALGEFENNQIYESTSTISLKSKIFLDYLIKFKLQEDRNLVKYFIKNQNSNLKIRIDYEHIVPQKRIEMQIGRSNIKDYPVSSIGNLCYLASTDNRSKKEKTLYEFAEGRPSYICDSEYLNLVNYPEKEELNFLDYSSVEFDKKYKEFISNRINCLILEFKMYLNKQ